MRGLNLSSIGRHSCQAKTQRENRLGQGPNCKIRKSHASMRGKNLKNSRETSKIDLVDEEKEQVT